MSDKLKAAEAIKKLARMYEPMVEAAETLARIGSLEQAEDEGHQRLEVIQAEVEVAKSGLSDAVEKITLANEKALGIVEKATNEASAVNKNALQDAQDIKLDAQENAEHAIASATQAGQDAANKARAELAAIEEQLSFGKANLVAMDERKAQAQSELDTLNAAIEGAKQAVAKIVG